MPKIRNGQRRSRKLWPNVRYADTLIHSLWTMVYDLKKNQGSELRGLRGEPEFTRFLTGIPILS